MSPEYQPIARLPITNSIPLVILGENNKMVALNGYKCTDFL
jgi:hypothetical protein